jgi:hypothetical protein
VYPRKLLLLVIPLQVQVQVPKVQPPLILIVDLVTLQVVVQVKLSL